MSLMYRLALCILMTMINIVKVYGRSTSRKLAGNVLFQSIVSITSNSTSDLLHLHSTLPLQFESDKLTKKLQENTVFTGYRKIVRRDILLPNGKVANFDVVFQKHLSVVVFVWDSASATGSLVREYHPGPERFLYGTVAGMCEGGKHESAIEAAKFELEEEAQLQTDKWYPLLQEVGTMMPLDKYSNNNFLPFLALDCQPVMNPRPADDEEFISIHHNVTYHEMMNLIRNGNMNVVSTYTIMLGFQKLLELGIPFNRS